MGVRRSSVQRNHPGPSPVLPQEAGLGRDAQRKAGAEVGMEGQGGAGKEEELPIESEMVFSVSDEVRVDGQEMPVQQLPCLEHTFCGGLGRRKGGHRKLRP